ncbi:N-(5'-phosphoribosyl)anthranilate isomerase [Tabrizicola sp. M-4]|uniref:N-(5'-phosphoribosyl)anthranilate isomerase n=1 Tax=Tabrizicola sp. M-4 TaxID=3055847 RepID=UPI003DA90070
MQHHRLSPPDVWIDQIFSAKAAVTGGVIRRNVDWVEREIGQDRFFLEVRKRGFHLMRAGNQYLILCAADPIQFLF